MESNTRTTDAKKLYARRTKDGMLYEAHFEHGGEIPGELRGVYTDLFTINNAIEKYLKTRPARGARKNGSS